MILQKNSKEKGYEWNKYFKKRSKGIFQHNLESIIQELCNFKQEPLEMSNDRIHYLIKEIAEKYYIDDTKKMELLNLRSIDTYNYFRMKLENSSEEVTDHVINI